MPVNVYLVYHINILDAGYSNYERQFHYKPCSFVSDEQVVHYDYERHGCPFQVQFDEPFRPTVDM